jgi:hypothetical protein
MCREIQDQFNNAIKMQLKKKHLKSVHTLNIMMEFHHKLNATF